MPAFTFEKIAPVRRGPAAAAPKKPGGVISQLIGRLADRRAKGSLRRERDPHRGNEKPSG